MNIKFMVVLGRFVELESIFYKTYQLKNKFGVSRIMNTQDYLLRKVEPEEFRDLKRQEKDIVSAVLGEVNDEWKPKVQGIIPKIKYNLSRNTIGIYLGEQLVIDNENLGEAEKVVVQSLYTALEKRLDRIRLPNEPWVDALLDDDLNPSGGVDAENLPF